MESWAGPGNEATVQVVYTHTWLTSYNQLFFSPTSVDTVVIVVSLIALVLETTVDQYLVIVRPIKLARYS